MTNGANGMPALPPELVAKISQQPGRIIRNDRCEKCAFCQIRPKQAGRNQVLFECHLNPPPTAHFPIGMNQQTNEPIVQTFSGFPIVQNDSWCGQWKARVIQAGAGAIPTQPPQAEAS